MNITCYADLRKRIDEERSAARRRGLRHSVLVLGHVYMDMLVDQMFERANRFGTDLCLGDLYVHGMKVIVAAGDEIACFEQREFAWC